MIERLTTLVLDESKWLAAAMLVGLVVVLFAVARRRPDGPRRVTILRVMHLYYGCMIGVMASGHLLAVTIESIQGALEGSPWLLYPLGVILAVPAWWLVLLALRGAGAQRANERAQALDAWLGVCLLALGLHNWPLAAPAALNIAYGFHTRSVAGWTIVGVTIALYLVLFAGSLVFLVSGQSFEQFRGV